MLDVAQRQIDYAVALDERCQGLSQDQVAEHVDWWRAAALSGHVPSMVHYAKGDGFRLNATLDNLDRLAAYRGEAERLMRAAAAAGSAEALQQLLLSYAPERDPRGTLLQQAIDHIDAGMPQDLTTSFLHQALHHIGLITGEVSNEDVLDSIFRNFCIGK